jgi:putative molybdopterin biosynthesis protein
MESLQPIRNFEHIKLLADARRLEILRLLMAEPGTLSTLGRVLGEHPARARHHLKLLEQAGLVELVGTRPLHGFVEKYYRATAQAFMLSAIVLPAWPEGETLVALVSHDLALDLLARRMEQIYTGFKFLPVPVGSLDGLVALRQGLARLAGCHLLDADTGQYNLPYVRHFFPDRSMAVLTLAYRQQGLLVAPGNPLGIRGLQDLAREDVLLINRNPGSGTRLWLDRQLRLMGLPSEAVRGYDQEVHTHTAVAEAVAQGRANAGIGLQAAARQFSLDFIPLFQERYDLVLPEEDLGGPSLQPLFELLNSGQFRKAVTALSGYETAHTGERLTLLN